MKISYKWLKEYIDFDLTPLELQDKMTFSGIEVEAVEETGDFLKQFKVAKIISKEAHENAEKLSVCQVNDGNETFQVVCGAPNCALDQKIAFAPVGTKFDDFVIKKAKLRGVQSFGMICSEKEMGISENHDGIMVLDNDAPVGSDLADYLNLNDTIFDVEITPNRPDLLGMIGVARDLSAQLNLQIKLPINDVSFVSEEESNNLTIDNQTEEKCLRYSARLIKNVTIKESPEWLKNRLIALGLRPINNIVDITNFVMFEFGHPLHAFDYKKIDQQKIIIRKAKNGEKIDALDNNSYELNSEDLVIADANKPIAIAGVIGGANSEITSQTTDVVLEVANFLYSSVRKTSGRLKIFTDSAYRFERGLTSETIAMISNRATQLILDIAGGELDPHIWDSYPNKEENKLVEIRTQKVRDFLTIDIDSNQIKKYLEALGLKTVSSNEEKQIFEIPFFRNDLTREIDLIEEIIRLHGYNNVAPKMKLQKIMKKKSFYLRRKIQDFMVSKGFYEVVNWPFSDPNDLDKLEIPADSELRNTVTIKNPIGIRYSIMQTILLPNLLSNLKNNKNYGFEDQKLFELTKTFFKSDKLAKENFSICCVLTGKNNSAHWNRQSNEIDFFDVKGLIEDLLDATNIQETIFKPSELSFLQSGISADVFSRKNRLGYLGKIDKKIAEKFDIDIDAFMFSLDIKSLLDSINYEFDEFIDLPKIPAVKRDLSFIISDSYSYDEIVDEIYKADKTLIKNVTIFDEFKGKNIENGFRSLSFSFFIGANTKTLTDKKLNKVVDKVINRLKFKFEIEMR